MAKESSSGKTKATKATKAARAPKVISPAYVSDTKSEDESEIAGEDDGDDTDDSDELEDVAPRRRTNGDSANAAGPSRPGPSSQLPRYTPPMGMMPLPLAVNFASSPFEWDAMANNPGMELWAIRAPVDLKAARLSRLNIIMSHAGPSGTMNHKQNSYTLRSAGNPTPATADVDAEGRQPTAGPGMADAMTMDEDGGERLKFEGGAEMLGGMRLMVPRVKEKGKLFAAPIAVTRHLILVPNTSFTTSASHDNPLPSLLATSALDDALDGNSSISHPPAKRHQPTHLMKFRNFAVGSSTPGPDAKPALPSTADDAPDHHVSESAVAVDTEQPKKKRKSEAEREASRMKKKAKSKAS